jgi:predicted nucleic acid-binding protein
MSDRGDQASLERFDTFFAQSDLLWLELSAAVVELATSLRASHGLRTPDALQAACCLHLGPEAVMLSGDADFGRVAGLRLQLIRVVTAFTVVRDGDHPVTPAVDR